MIMEAIDLFETPFEEIITVQFPLIGKNTPSKNTRLFLPDTDILQGRNVVGISYLTPEDVVGVYEGSTINFLTGDESAGIVINLAEDTGEDFNEVDDYNYYSRDLPINTLSISRRSGKIWKCDNWNILLGLSYIVIRDTTGIAAGDVLVFQFFINDNA